MGKTKISVIEDFFNLRSWSELDEFLTNLDSSVPFEAALGYYGNSWIAPDDVREPFVPRNFVSRDLSATYLRNFPVIFQGTNHWSEKLYYSEQYYEDKLNEILDHCSRFRSFNQRNRICLLIIPEKDFVISWEYLKEARFNLMVCAISRLRTKLAEYDIELIFEEPIVGIAHHMDISEYTYQDSHLHPRNYVAIFARALRALGLDWLKVSPNIEVTPREIYLDLNDKFDNGGDKSSPFCELNFFPTRPMQVFGSDYFENPLGRTNQEFQNNIPIFEEDIQILGDSHSSIYDQKRLTYLFANSYRKTQFSWNPVGLRADDKRSSASHIILEISQRFLF
jgi:hypothetical protein